MKGNLLIISGPSGSGKSSLIHGMMKEVQDTYFSISTTTRKKREYETDGKDYFFTSKERFEEEIEKGYFLEWARVHDNYYGTSLKQILSELSKGKTVILDIDVQGYKIAKKKFKDIITSIFITTPTLDTLKKRLLKRGTDNEKTISKRLSNALSEMEEIEDYDFFLVNDDFEKTLNDLISIVRASKRKTALMDKEDFILSWKGDFAL